MLPIVDRGRRVSNPPLRFGNSRRPQNELVLVAVLADYGRGGGVGGEGPGPAFAGEVFVLGEGVGRGEAVVHSGG